MENATRTPSTCSDWWRATERRPTCWPPTKDASKNRCHFTFPWHWLFFPPLLILLGTSWTAEAKKRNGDSVVAVVAIVVVVVVVVVDDEDEDDDVDAERAIVAFGGRARAADAPVDVAAAAARGQSAADAARPRRRRPPARAPHRPPAAHHPRTAGPAGKRKNKNRATLDLHCETLFSLTNTTSAITWDP